MTGKGMMANLRKAGMTSSCTIWVGPPPTRPRRTMRLPAAEIGFTSDESARSRRARSLSAGSSPLRRI
jgi:hypothetical protein